MLSLSQTLQRHESSATSITLYGSIAWTPSSSESSHKSTRDLSVEDAQVSPLVLINTPSSGSETMKCHSFLPSSTLKIGFSDNRMRPPFVYSFDAGAYRIRASANPVDCRTDSLIARALERRLEALTHRPNTTSCPPKRPSAPSQPASVGHYPMTLPKLRIYRYH